MNFSKESYTIRKGPLKFLMSNVGHTVDPPQKNDHLYPLGDPTLDCLHEAYKQVKKEIEDQEEPDINHCPFCFHKECALIKSGAVYLVKCRNCEACGPISQNKDRAVRMWIDANKTLEEK